MICNRNRSLNTKDKKKINIESEAEKNNMACAIKLDSV